MKIIIDKKTFELVFGFKCFMNLGRALGLKTFNEVVAKFAQFEDGKDDISFDQLELIEQLVIAAAEANPKYYDLGYSIMDVSVIDGVMSQPELLGNIMKAFVDSLPKSEGKQKASPQVRKQLPKKKA